MGYQILSMSSHCRITLVLLIVVTGVLLISLPTHPALARQAVSQTVYLGFDRNDYPGDQNLPALRKTFDYSGYWLNNPPGAKSNSWLGKRQTLESAGFGFLVLFNGRTDAQIKSSGSAAAQGRSDAQGAVAQARKEGFSALTTVFLDQEEGGRLLPEQKAYLFAWVDQVISSGLNAGVYCSAVPFQEGNGTMVNTAEDIRENAGKRQIAFWVVNDACPPSPGCAFPKQAPSTSNSGFRFADVWQYAQSPRRKDVAISCLNYSSDANCYPPGIDPKLRLHVDVNAAISKDPSHGRSW